MIPGKWASQVRGMYPKNKIYEECDPEILFVSG